MLLSGMDCSRWITCLVGIIKFTKNVAIHEAMSYDVSLQVSDGLTQRSLMHWETFSYCVRHAYAYDRKPLAYASNPNVMYLL